MSDKKLSQKEREQKFNEFLVEEYFKHGSVDEVFRKRRYNLPISYANYQRILDKWGVVKKAGPNSKLTEAIEFFSYLAKENVPFEELYRRMPPSFQTSATTLYRILSYVKEGITRRVGCALVITPYSSSQKILLGRDVSTPRIELGKQYGAMSLPMGYARKRDSRKTNITRILQQEVLAGDTIKGSFPKDVLPENPTPFMYLDIADVRVAVYHLALPKSLSKLKSFSSFKLKNYKFMSVEEIVEGKIKGLNFRAGVVEAVGGYLKYLKLLDRNLSVNPLQQKSIMNVELAEVVIDISS